MIELVDSETCTACNICVRVCPANVFEAAADAPPSIARQADCQTCFMCELYCPEDALYVHPDAERPSGVGLPEVKEAGLLGSYRRNIGWTRESRDNRASDMSYKFLGKG